MKVFELAKELNVSNDEIIEELQGLGSEIKHHASVIDDELLDKVRGKFPQEEDTVIQENKMLKDRLAKMEEMMQELMAKKEMVPQQEVIVEDEFDIQEIPMNKVIKVMSLFDGVLNLKTSNDNTAQVVRFEFVGQILPVIYQDLVKIVGNQRKFFEDGYCMILDKNVVRAHYLEKFYKKFVDGNVINNILDYEVDRIVEIFTRTTKVIQQTIIDIVVKKINSNDYVDKNKVAAIGDIYDIDIFALANKLK